jgi:glycosyltransferase involved in cell wall biosynthesis
MQTACDVSVIVVFRDHEDHIGTAVRRLAEHLRESCLSFEVVAVDEGSVDNSSAVLALLRNAIPELRIMSAASRRGLSEGATHARGHVLWILGPRAARRPLAPFARAYRQVTSEERDFVAIERRFVVARRTRVLPLLDDIRTGPGALSRLAKSCRNRGLSVELRRGGESKPTHTDRLGRPLARLFGALPRWSAS